MSQLQDRLDETDTELTPKPNYAVWWHELAARVMYGVFGVLRRTSDFEGRFDEDYYTTLGRHIYTPAGREIDLEEPRMRAVIAHELAHRYQDRRRGWRDHRLAYVLNSRYRARAEFEACAVQMAAYHREMDELPDDWPASLASNIASAAYLWPIEESTARDCLEALADDARHGRIRSFDPTESPTLQSTLNQYLSAP